WREYQRDLVADAAGRMLVDLGARNVGKVDHDTGAQHDVNERCQLGIGQPDEKDRHQEGGHLVLLDAATRVPVEERAQLVAAQLTAIPLAAAHLVWCHLVRFQWSASDSGAGSPRETRPHTSKISAIQS